MKRTQFTQSLLGLAAATTGAASAQVNREPYKIGLTFPLTGPLASSSNLYAPGAEIAASEINNAGGINGHPVQLVIEDTQGTPQGGITAMRKVTSVDGVQCILTIYTNVVTAQIPLAEQLKVPLLCSVETDVLRHKSPYAFSHAATSENKGRLFAAYWKRHKVKRIYAFVVNNAAGPFFSSVGKAAATQAGAAYQEASFNDGDNDYRGLVARARDYKPDGIYLAELGGLSGVQIIRQLREAGVSATVIMPGIFFYEPSWKNGIGSYIESIVMSGINYDPRAGQKFVTAYEAKVGTVPTYQAGEQYDMIRMFALAIARSSYNGEAIRNQIANFKNCPSVFGGDIVMDATNYSVPSGDSLWQVRNNKLVSVKV